MSLSLRSPIFGTIGPAYVFEFALELVFELELGRANIWHNRSCMYFEFALESVFEFELGKASAWHNKSCIYFLDVFWNMFLSLSLEYIWTMPLLMAMLSQTMQLEQSILTTIANKTCTARNLKRQAQPSLKK